MEIQLLNGVIPDVEQLHEQIHQLLPEGDEPEEVGREMIYVTIRKEHLINLRNPLSGTSENQKNIEKTREEIANSNPYFYFSEAPEFYHGREGYVIRDDLPVKLRKTPHYIIKGTCCADESMNREKIFEQLEQAMKQVRSLEMLSIFDFTMDINFTQRLKTVTFDFKKVTKLNLQCSVDLSQTQFLEFLQIFSLESILLWCSFLQEVKLDECLGSLTGRIIILDDIRNDTVLSVSALSNILLNQWKLNPPRQIKITAEVDWTFSQLWSFIKNIAGQKRAEHKKATYYTLGGIKNTPDDWTAVARAKMQRDFTWRCKLMQGNCYHYVITPKDSVVNFVFDLLMLEANAAPTF